VQAKFLEVKQANTLEGVATYTTEPPFSFTYGGRPSAGLLGSWKLERDRRKLDEQRTEQTLTSTIGGWMPVGMYMMERVGQR